MNKYFLPKAEEQRFLDIIQRDMGGNVSIRITQNMLRKHHIDAIKEFRFFLRSAGIFEYDTLLDGQKEIKEITLIFPERAIETIISFNRSSNRRNRAGDPRFWISAIKKEFKVGTLFTFCIYQKQLFAVKVDGWISLEEFEEALKRIIRNSFEVIKGELIEAFRKVRGLDIISISPNQRNDKDAGDTFENAIGLKSNSSKKADFKEQIEIKTKGEKKGTKDSCFNRIPDPEISPIPTTKILLLKYGYEDNNKIKYPDYKSLFVDVGITPNTRGFYLEVDDLNEYIVMKHQTDGVICRWHFQILKERLETKHPATLWLEYEETKINNEIYFIYKSATMTKKPDFAAFVQLVSEGKVTYSWRARVRKNGTGYDDHGNGFRLAKRHRQLIFGDPEII